MSSASSRAQHSPDPAQIQRMFASIADGYDRANTILSAGIHHRWRKAVVEFSGARNGDVVLDCATGTGDLAIEFKTQVGLSGRVTGSDFCAEMLEHAPAKAQQRRLDITFEVADVMALPYESNSFDIASIAFGIRNVADPTKALSELHRVVKPGGKVVVLEFGQPRIPVFRGFYRLYSEKVLPRMGGLITGRPEAYKYLEKSSAKFPCREDFVALMNRAASFEKVEYRALSLGIAYMYRGVVSSK